MPNEQTLIIKKSICFRAKYRVRNGLNKYPPSLVVPHRHNRGGDPIAPTRLRQLSGMIAYDAYDRIEASTNDCVVQQKAVANGGPGKDFQAAFPEQVKADRDIAEFGVEGTSAIVASLSHCHPNCIARNIKGGKRGCECLEPAVGGR